MLNISVQHKIPVLDGDEYSVIIFSDDNASCNTIYNIITNVFNDNDAVFKASGFPENIDEVFKNMQNCKSTYFKGDTKKFFIRKYPEIYAKISDDKVLRTLINNWTSTVYERRFFYILKSEQLERFYWLLDKNVYKDTNNLIEAWQHLDCLIENIPDAENHHSFIMTFRKKFSTQITTLLQHNVI